MTITGAMGGFHAAHKRYLERDRMIRGGGEDERRDSRAADEDVVMLSYVAWKVFASLLQVIPTALSYHAADLVGAVTFACWRRGRRATAANYSIVLPGASHRTVRRVARRSLENYCRYLVDFARFSGERPKNPGVTGGLEHIEELRARLATGHGAVITLTHAGNWDAGGAALVRAGIDLAVVGERVGGARLDRAVRQSREQAGMRLLMMGRDTLAMARLLRQGGVLAVLVDRPDHESGVPITFFGEPTRVPDGAARLALASGAMVVAASCTRRSPTTSELILQADFDVAMPAERHAPEASQQLMQAIFTAHERFIRRQPSQWYMFRQFWPGVSDPR